MKYYILSLNHTNNEALLWWRPNNSGYTIYIGEAGQYDSEVVKSNKSYYDNKRETAAIPCNIADEFAVKIIPSSANMDKFVRFTEEIGA